MLSLALLPAPLSAHSTQVRKALEGDLEEALRIARDGKASKGWWA